MSVELVNICNLHCNYCFRSDEVLYSKHANFFSIDLLTKILNDARHVADVTRVIFTGGEPTLHPQFGDILRSVGSAGLTSSFVTNGWHFDRVWPLITANRDCITDVAFSFDGITRESHDGCRGAGSFDHLIRAISRCHRSQLPFAVKVVIRRENMDQLESIALFAARMGAAALNFVHMMPTSNKLAADASLTLEERRLAEEEVAILKRVFRMQIGIDVGYYNINPLPPCSPLAGTSMNVDHEGRLTLCCNLSCFRGAESEGDVVADLKTEPFESAYRRYKELASTQLKRRSEILAELQQKKITPDLYSGSPCLLCLQSFGKLPWYDNGQMVSAHRQLPVHNIVA